MLAELGGFPCLECWDLVEWPGGFGENRGLVEDWDGRLTAYCFNDAGEHSEMR